MLTDYCPTCGGEGTVEYYVGTYGTSSCHGIADRTCEDCEGTGEHPCHG